jgi:large subunit ribosomal protein L24
VSPVRAALKIEGNAGIYGINLQVNADDIGDPLAADNVTQAAASKLNLVGTLKADDGAALVELLGLEPFLVVDKRPGQIDLKANGTIDGEMAVDGRLVAGGLDGTANGKLRVSGAATPSAELAVKVERATLRNPQPPASGNTAPNAPLPGLLLTLPKGQIVLTNERVELNGLEGRLAGTEVRGRLAIDRTAEQKLSGELEFGEIVLPVVISAAIGAPAQVPAQPPPQSIGATRAWPSEPFDRGLLDRLNGSVALKAGRVSLSPNLAARNVRGVVQLDRSALVLKNIDGSLAGGQVAGDIAFERGPEGLTLRAHVKFTDADLAELIRGGPPPVSGRLTLDATLEGTGRSPIAIVGSLDGKGTFSVKDGRIRRVDPGIFDVVIRGVDQGLPFDALRLSERIEQVLGANGIAVPQAEGAIVVTAGQARLNNLVLRSEKVELALGGSVTLADDLIDVRMTLSGAGRTDGAGGLQPEIGISLKGPVDSPRRTLDVANFTNWLQLRAVEQQSKHIDLLESGRDLPVDPAAPRAPRATSPTTPFARAPRAPRNPNDSVPALPGIARPRSLVMPPLDLRPPVQSR